MSQDPCYVADSRRLYLPPMEHRSPAAPRGTKRDQIPIPMAACQVIREQIAENATKQQKRKRARREQQHPSPVAVGHAGTRTSLPTVPGHASSVPQTRVPTCQEMYNTWRALGEQMNNISRVPAFIKSDRMLCHRCRILKLQCNCYDYSELENAYQEEDHRLRQTALCQIPASDALLLPGASASPAVQYPTVSAAYEYVDGIVGDSEASGGPWPVRRQQPATLSPLPPTPLPPALPAEPPRLLQYEIREEVLARERIGAQKRLWCCQFSTMSSPEGRVFACTREDENVQTIRRHYSREHGSLRRRTGPTVRTYCSGCNYVVPANGAPVAPPPHQCPGCGAADGRLWLRMLYAEVEVPVPPPLPRLQLQLPESGSTGGLRRYMDGTSSADSNTGTAVTAPAEDPFAVSAPPEMPMLLQPPALVLPQQELPQMPTPISPNLYEYWMSPYPMAGGGNLLVDTNSHGGGSSMAPQTPMTPGGFPPALTAATTTTTMLAPYPALAETTAVYPSAWGLPAQAEAQQPQHPQQQQQD